MTAIDIAQAKQITEELEHVARNLCETVNRCCDLNKEINYLIKEAGGDYCCDIHICENLQENASGLVQMKKVLEQVVEMYMCAEMYSQQYLEEQNVWYQNIGLKMNQIPDSLISLLR